MGWGWKRGLVILFLCAAPSILFLRVCHYPFIEIFDDGIHVSQNSDLHGPVPRFWTGPYLGLYVPVTYSVWAGIAAISSSPTAFHIANLVTHLANGGLVFLLLRLIVGAEIGAAAGALFFLVHPLVVEPVAWVSALKDLLGALFGLAALLLFLRARKAPSYLAALACFLLACLAKPSAVCLPLIAAALNRYRGVARVEISRDLFPWALFALPIVFFTKLQQPDFQLGDVPSVGQRFLVACDALVASITHLVAPFRLTVNYGRTPEEALLHPRELWLAAAFCALLVAMLSRPFFRRARVPVFLFVAAWLPTSGLVPFYYQHYSTVADRFLYFALLGPALALALAIGEKPPRWALGVVAVLVVALAARTSDQLRYWASPLALVLHMTDVNPRPENHYTAGVLLAETGRYREAGDHYAEATRRRPTFAMAYNNWGLTLDALGRAAEAEEKYRTAIENDPTLAQAYNNLGAAHAKRGEMKEARELFQKALVLVPDFEDAKRNLATARAMEGGG